MMHQSTALPPGTRADLGALEAAAGGLLAQEREVYAARRPRSRAARQAGSGYFDGLPMHWMADWPMPFPMLIERAAGARLTDIDGNAVVDLCLGDSGAMFGHGPPPVLAALRECAATGLTTMLPSADAPVVSALLVQRFRLPQWQIATTASDANRFALRVARAVTGRRKVLVFDGCYHGAVEEALVEVRAGRTLGRRSLLGQALDPGDASVAIPFNDAAALERALATREIAVVLAEPVMTNCGMILPQPGFLAALREATRRHDTLLLYDETHTLSSGLGGYAVTHGLQPDLLVAGKAVGGGVPVSIWGFSAEVAARLRAVQAARDCHGPSGIGTTLSGSALQLACLRACLEQVMSAQCYAIMNARADRIETGLRDAIAAHRLPWHVSRVGARLEVVFSPRAVRNAAEARAAAAPALTAALHLALLNLGYLLTPFHNMMLTSPVLEAADADGFVAAYTRVLERLAAAQPR